VVEHSNINSRRILGIDPGSVITGYGVIESDGNHNKHISSGAIRIKGDNLASKLGDIFLSISDVLDRYKPDEMAIEQVFMHRNADSALKLGQARGAAICAVVTRNIPVHEYTPRLIKQAVVGKGSATKQQVQHMVGVLLNLKDKPQTDAADALAVALCHGHIRTTDLGVAGDSVYGNKRRAVRWKRTP